MPRTNSTPLNELSLRRPTNGEMYVDDKKIYTAEKLKVGLFKDPSNF